MSTLSSIDGHSKQPHVMLAGGAVMPRIGLGTWRSPNGEVEAAVYEAIKIGYRHIDCARVYGNEAEVGRGIARALKEGICKREELFVTSKIWNNAHAPEHTRANLEASLKDLQLEYIDLWLIHWPNTFTWGKDGSEIFPRNEKGHIILDDGKESGASIKACWQTMEEAVDQKKVRSIGVSNFVQSEIDEVLSYAKKPVAVNQIEIHPYFPQQDMIDYCKSKDIVIEAYSPLGNLKNPGEEDVTPLNDPVVAELAKKHKKTAGQVVLRWGLQHSGVILPKSTNAGRIAENFDIINDFELDAEDMAKMAELGKKNKRFLNPQFRENGAPVFKA